ncbi:MAG: restriction endonuclease subunit S, partial [Flavobacterium sp.]
NELIQKDKALIAKYDELTQALFLDMFGDPVSNPKGWEKVELNYFINKLNTGVSVNSEETSNEKGEYLILKTSCVYSGIFNPNQVKTIRKDEIHRAKLNPKKDSIIISRMNTSELVGKSAYIFEDYPNIFLPDRLWQTEKTNLEHSVLWLSYNIGHNSFMNEISKISSGTSGSMKNISKSTFLKLKSINPPLKLQNQFAERVQVIEQQKAIAQKSLEKSEELFNSLLQRAFKGELV